MRASNGLSTVAQRLLDSGSSVSFISERLAQHLCLPRTHRAAHISGIAGISHDSFSQPITSFSISSTHAPKQEVPVMAKVLSKLTCELPLHNVTLDSHWNTFLILDLVTLTLVNLDM